MRRLRAALVALVVVVGLTSAVASPAQAALSDCWYGYVCMWAENGGPAYTGTIHRIPAMPLGYCYNIPSGSGFNDKADYFANELATRHVQFYRDRDCTGHLLHRQSDCWQGPFRGQTYGQFQFKSTFSCSHSATYDANSATSVFFNTG
jgi:Peptidase inhibitor family I36